MNKPFFHCPNCKSKDITGGNIEIDVDVWQEVTCEKCGYEWNEIYLFSHAENENGNEIDKDGKILPPLDPWEEDPKYPRADWQYIVGNGDTNLGYWDWVNSCKEDSEYSPLKA